jgi:hypothetical protein
MELIGEEEKKEALEVLVRVAHLAKASRQGWVK